MGKLTTMGAAFGCKRLKSVRNTLQDVVLIANSFNNIFFNSHRYQIRLLSIKEICCLINIK